MRVTPRRVLWVVVVSAFLLTIKDDVVSVMTQDALNQQILVDTRDIVPDVPQAALQSGVPPAPQSSQTAQSVPGAPPEPTEPLTPEEQEIHEWETLQANRKHVVNQICKEVREHADVEFPPAELLFKYMTVDHVHKVIMCPYQGAKKTNNYKKALSWVAQSSLIIRQKSESYLKDMPEAPPPAFLQDLAVAQRSAPEGNVTGPTGNTTNSTMGAAPAGGAPSVNATPSVSATDLEFGHNYTAEQVQYMLKNYVKVMFPDHPYERLLAVFDQKFTNRSDEVGVTLGRAILRMSRPGAKWKEVTEAPLYFHEYMNFVLKKKGTISDFMIYYDMCHVCDIEWDYIGKTDTYERDATHIMKAVEGEDSFSHNATETDLERIETQELQQHMVENYKNITEYEMLRLYDDFSLDMYLFDFQWPFSNLTLMREDPSKDGKYA